MMRVKTTFCYLFAISMILVSSIPIKAALNNDVIFASDGTSTDYVGISTDGNYDDWEDKPHSRINYAWDAANSYHLGSLFRDEEYVYLHIAMSPYSYTQFNGYNYGFTVDGVAQYVVAVPPNGQKITDGNNELVIRNQNGYGIINGAAGIVTRLSGQSDEWELRIPLSFFSNTPDNVKTIEFYCPNLGPQKLVATGTPTLPFAVAGAGLVFASVGYVMSNRKCKK